MHLDIIDITVITMNIMMMMMMVMRLNGDNNDDDETNSRLYIDTLRSRGYSRCLICSVQFERFSSNLLRRWPLH